MFTLIVHIGKGSIFQRSLNVSCLEKYAKILFVTKLVLLNTQDNKRSNSLPPADVSFFFFLSAGCQEPGCSLTLLRSADWSLSPPLNTRSNKWGLTWEPWAGRRSCSWCFWLAGRSRWVSTGTQFRARLFDIWVSERLDIGWLKSWGGDSSFCLFFFFLSSDVYFFVMYHYIHVSDWIWLWATIAHTAHYHHIKPNLAWVNILTHTQFLSYSRTVSWFGRHSLLCSFLGHISPKAFSFI